MTGGGFRCSWLARLTRGRIGLGRWTQAEVDSINTRAAAQHRELSALIDDGRDPIPCPRCGEVCTYDGWGHVHRSGLGIGSCNPRPTP